MTVYIAIVHLMAVVGMIYSVFHPQNFLKVNL
jgi:hypothetical protein